MVTNFESFLGRLLRDTRITNIAQRAYVLATVKHECDNQWKPITEKYNGNPEEYFNKKYGHRKDLGNVLPGDGFRYRGRGYCQLTGRDLYKRLGDRLGFNLELFPEKALDVDISYEILSVGMSEGLYTQGGRSLTKFLPSERGVIDYVNARRIVNGTDKAELIAGYARQYEDLLRRIRRGV